MRAEKGEICRFTQKVERKPIDCQMFLLRCLLILVSRGWVRPCLPTQGRSAFAFIRLQLLNLPEAFCEACLTISKNGRRHIIDRPCARITLFDEMKPLSSSWYEDQGKKPLGVYR